MKLLVLVLVVVAVLWLARAGRKLRGRDATASKRPPPPIEDMVTCAHCGLHLPRSDAIEAGMLHYCGEAHRIAHQQEDRSR
jgi:uncharacterized protein